MSWLPRIGLLLATLLFVLLLAEGVARLVVGIRDSGAGRDPRLEGLPEIRDVLRLAEPNVTGVHRGVLYRTNARGLRGPDYEEGDPADRFRILVAGDSVTVGWAVAEEDAYAQQLESLLEAEPPAGPAGPQRFEVINLGLAGVNADFASRRLEKLADVYGADLHVYGFTANDIYGPRYRAGSEGAKRPGLSEAGEAAWRRALRFHDAPSVLLRELWPRWVMLVERDAFQQSDATLVDRESAELRANYFENPEAWADFTAALDRIAAVAAARGVCAHVLLHTHLTMLDESHPYAPIYARVRDAARERGLSVTETWPLFAGHTGSELWVHRFDVHPNAEGHAVLARALYEGLRGLPARCWRQSAGAGSSSR